MQRDGHRIMKPEMEKRGKGSKKRTYLERREWGGGGSEGRAKKGI